MFADEKQYHLPAHETTWPTDSNSLLALPLLPHHEKRAMQDAELLCNPEKRKKKGNASMSKTEKVSISMFQYVLYSQACTYPYQISNPQEVLQNNEKNWH